MIGAIADLDYDVTSIQAAVTHGGARRYERDQLLNGVGPGVCQHSLATERLRAEEMADASLPCGPRCARCRPSGCGGAFRLADEDPAMSTGVTASLHNMVAAAGSARGR